MSSTRILHYASMHQTESRTLTSLLSHPAGSQLQSIHHRKRITDLLRTQKLDSDQSHLLVC